MLDEPPPETRPTWKADTIVVPNWNVSGSTSVWCWAWRVGVRVVADLGHRDIRIGDGRGDGDDECGDGQDQRSPQC